MLSWGAAVPLPGYGTPEVTLGCTASPLVSRFRGLPSAFLVPLALCSGSMTFGEISEAIQGGSGQAAFTSNPGVPEGGVQLWPRAVEVKPQTALEIYFFFASVTDCK